MQSQSPKQKPAPAPPAQSPTQLEVTTSPIPNITDTLAAARAAIRSATATTKKLSRSSCGCFGDDDE